MNNKMLGSVTGALILLAGSSGFANVDQAPDKKTMKISSTMDFLDHCYEETDPKVGYFTEAQLEKVFIDLKNIGVDKINYRVNACGLQHYNTTHGKKFAGDGRIGCENLARTLEKYDPCQLSIELGKKYGIEVFAWDSLGDDNPARFVYQGGHYVWWSLWTICRPGSQSKMIFGNEPLVDTQENLAKIYGAFPMLDPYYLKNKAASMRYDPKTVSEKVSVKNSRLPATRIVIDSYYTNKLPCKITKDDLSVYVSDENSVYKKYEGDFSLKIENESPVRLVLDGLNIPEKYACLIWKKARGDIFTMALKGSALKSGARVYSGDKEITTCWTYTRSGHPAGNEALFSLDFSSVTLNAELPYKDSRNYAWDYRNVCIGYCKGVADYFESKEHNFTREYRLGVPEYANAKLMEYKVAKFKDLAKYAWDGFTINLRTHNPHSEADKLGFGLENRDKFLKKYGVDVYQTDNYDKKAWNDLRAEPIDEFLSRIRQETGNRPLYMNVPARHADNYAYLGAWDSLQWHPDVWLKAKSVDGLCALFWDADKPLADLVKTNDSAAKIIQFYQINDGPTPDKFKQDLIKYQSSGIVDELEIYQTTVLLKGHNGKYGQVLKEFTGKNEPIQGSKVSPVTMP
ncbi:MAG: hypothetical protein NT011_07460 [Kiritimatiellaeota bacterium]|nr:hypothetical protein [Kiritimatiellota bacterium]